MITTLESNFLPLAQTTANRELVYTSSILQHTEILADVTTTKYSDCSDQLELPVNTLRTFFFFYT